MSCLELAKRLANKRVSLNSSAFAPSPKKYEKKHLKVKKSSIDPKTFTPQTTISSENEDANIPTKTVLKPVIRLQEKHDYIPPFSRIFTDKKLYHYFKKYITEKHLAPILMFCKSVKKFKEQFYSKEEKRYSRFQKIYEKYNRLPSHYVNAELLEHGMTMITPNSFDRCINFVFKVLQEREFNQFLDSRHYIKWILKYHNTEIY